MRHHNFTSFFCSRQYKLVLQIRPLIYWPWDTFSKHNLAKRNDASQMRRNLFSGVLLTVTVSFTFLPVLIPYFLLHVIPYVLRMQTRLLRLQTFCRVIKQTFCLFKPYCRLLLSDGKNRLPKFFEIRKCRKISWSSTKYGVYLNIPPLDPAMSPDQSFEITLPPILSTRTRCDKLRGKETQNLEPVTIYLLLRWSILLDFRRLWIYFLWF